MAERTALETSASETMPDSSSFLPESSTVMDAPMAMLAGQRGERFRERCLPMCRAW